MADNVLFSLAGRVAVVTGGANGIGAGIVDALAEAGATVVVADRDHDNAHVRVAALAEAGLRAVVVNNAALQDRQLLLEATAADWDRIQSVNARGAFLMTREIANRMVSGGRGGRTVLAIDGGFSIS